MQTQANAAAPTQTYYTSTGDFVDAIALRFLGSEAMTPELIELNPHLLGLGPVLPANIAITVPVTVPAATRKADSSKRRLF